ncbi:hypothetical protein C5167_013693 [Papaver somniferum]|uniref:Uncharacterized protein n=1 Tax=Papaver somniferum TaxID=3469 RepID=A0A4Y7J502_PAPSO|nr:hypothetical protein C5167_013693 [Papaver somniferum]
MQYNNCSTKPFVLYLEVSSCGRNHHPGGVFSSNGIAEKVAQQFNAHSMDCSPVPCSPICRTGSPAGNSPVR